MRMQDGAARRVQRNPQGSPPMDRADGRGPSSSRRASPLPCAHGLEAGQRRNIAVAFVSAFHAPFIDEDYDTLDAAFRVERLVGHGVIHAVKILCGVRRARVAFCWFASVYAFIAILSAVIFSKRSVMVLGGGDVASNPEWRYGMWRSRWRAPLLRFALKRADVILAVDDSLRLEAMQRARYSGANIQVLPTGYDIHFWKPSSSKEDIVLTVAVVDSQFRIAVKGIDTLVATARLLPHVRFTLVGIAPSIAEALNPPANLTCIGLRSRGELLPFYQRARIYCQPSRREGLSNALCEAMLCECVPVATDVGGTTAAIGGSGVVVPPCDLLALADAIERVRFSSRDGTQARERASSRFPRERRQRRLREVVRSLAE
jgi:glycosyltransferase involved in cell wall biosynthesis